MAEGFITRRGTPPPQFFLSFDGVDDFVSINNNMSGSLGELEITFVSNENHTGTSNAAFLTFDISNGGIIIGEATSNFSNETVSFFTPSGNNFYDAGNLDAATKYNIKLTWNGSQYVLSVNGVNVNTLEHNSNLRPLSDIQGLGKRANDTFYFNGQISFFKLTDTNNNVALEYLFDEGSGTTLNDSAGNNDGTIFGATWGEK